MAERRMFTKKVTDDDNFMSLSSSAQALYLHLSMSADDDGFCNQIAISMFKAHASTQDLQALLEKRYVYQFENGVIVIKHWRMANALRKDRYTPTAFQEEMAQLGIKENGAYTFVNNPNELEDEEKQDSPRQNAYKNSSLPYSFDYKIKRAFYGKPCPICGCLMQTNIDDVGIVSNNRIPTIQHNIPISKGGEHEIGNISVICKQCNVSLKDTQTDALNANEVASEWEKICGCRLVAKCLPQDRLGKDSIDKGTLIDSKESICSTEVQQVIDAWNEIGVNPVRYVKPNTTRYSLLRARIKQFGIDDILNAIDEVRNSQFLLGQNKNGWTIKFDWFIKPNNFQKVLEGNYRNTQKQSSGSAWLDRIDNAVTMVNDFYVIGGENDPIGGNA